MQWDEKDLDTQFTPSVYFWTPNSEILAKALDGRGLGDGEVCGGDGSRWPLPRPVEIFHVEVDSCSGSVIVIVSRCDKALSYKLQALVIKVILWLRTVRMHSWFGKLYVYSKFKTTRNLMVIVTNMSCGAPHS